MGKARRKNNNRCYKEQVKEVTKVIGMIMAIRSLNHINIRPLL